MDCSYPCKSCRAARMSSAKTFSQYLAFESSGKAGRAPPRARYVKRMKGKLRGRLILDSEIRKRTRGRAN